MWREAVGAWIRPPEVRGVGKPAEIAVGAAAQRLFRSPGSILERLQLRDATTLCPSVETRAQG